VAYQLIVEDHIEVESIEEDGSDDIEEWCSSDVYTLRKMAAFRMEWRQIVDTMWH